MTVPPWSTFSVSLVRTVGLSTQPSPSLSSQAANTEATCWNWAVWNILVVTANCLAYSQELTVVLLSPNTGTPKTVVCLGISETGLVFIGQVTLVEPVIETDRNGHLS